MNGPGNGLFVTDIDRIRQARTDKQRCESGMKTTERWYCQVEFAFNVDTEPSKPRHKGDSKIDFAQRALNEGFLPQLRDAFPGVNGINWIIVPYEDHTVARREG